MSLLDDGSQWLADAFQQEHDIPVLYSREPHGIGNEIQVTATVGRPVVEQEDGTYSTAAAEYRDFLIQAEQLTFSAPTAIHKKLHAPQAGEMILEHMAGSNVRRCYKVVEDPVDGPWRWHDTLYHTYRIHTVLVEEQYA